MAVVSLVYDDRLVRVAKESGTGYRFGEAKLPPHAVVDGVVRHKRPFETALKKALRSAKIPTDRSHRFAIAIPESRVFTKLVELPRIPSRELPETLYWQAKKLLPADPAHLAIDFQQITSPDPNKSLVLLLSAPRELIDSLWSALEQAGYLPELFLPRSTGLAQLAETPPHTPVLLVDAEDDHGINLIIAKNRTARFSTSLVLGKNPRQLLESVTQAIQFYEARDGQHRKVSEIVILPGPDADAFMKTLKAAHLPDVKLFGGSSNPYLVNLGLLRAQTRLNLLPPDYRAVLKERAAARVRNLLWFLELEVAFLILLLVGLQVSGLTEELGRKTATLRAAQAQAVNAESIRAYDALDQTLSKSTVLEQERSDLSLVYAQIREAQVPGIELTSLDYQASEKGLEVVGQRTNRSVFATFIQNLEADFPKMTIPVEAWSEAEGSPFRIRLRIS